MEAIKTHLGTKEQEEVFLLVDALDFQVTFGRSMLEEEETTLGYYKIFDLLDTDLSGRLDVKELQTMLDAVRSLPGPCSLALAGPNSVSVADTASTLRANVQKDEGSDVF